MTYNDRFIRACRKQSVDRLPVWYMRQAGRYDPEYRKIKEKYSLLEICRQPDLAAEVTMMPVKKLGVDAAILYSDIMNPVASMGIDFDIVAQVGPVIHNPIRTAKDVERLKPVDPEGDLGHILETIRILDAELNVPLITFTGAPFTIASYLIEGRPSKSYIRTKTMMYEAPEVWFALMDKLGDMVIRYIRAQIANGGKAFQLFDSWVGSLSPRDYVRYVLPVMERIYSELSDLGVPSIYFPGVSSGELLPYLHELKADVIGLDWRVSIAEGRKRLAGKYAVQGNLDPYLLTGPMDIIQREAAHIIDEGVKEPGYIFNLGHGLFPEASLDKLKQLTEFVHSYSAEAIASRK
ncbi:uroporphyrinogen decarboxylase [Paenibacillus sp. E194]|jgi:uroporphyrinogen decarboxylase|uniref:Uroporphyrinogen decarboxylase n=3 Tax=Paenibacillus TaxID=44249 RepID=S9SLU8_PAEAL|nr:MULTISPECIES: uroporphyrinogen decarboxylase [Paenibacillus]EPY06737.1 uroporphyrinogen decarboxylase [Paenibacillus alvei TS-15]EPY13813.1 uroporphyrinogen decarboxylase [Paenibacillus alvei A6-6i-x]KJB85027.1 uroporphyrinogen decarboxylase [Paenibacillus sp. E194]MCM3291536.1 uroporphyrinogen decarboxylase [Paenibacillus sp. MER 180]MCY9528072.1 uroporphyrinogen decarboxylase [Paenibacillus alvei]